MNRPSDIEVSMMKIELNQLRKGALVMAQHILAVPARGDEALTPARRVANDIVAAEAIAADEPSQVPA